MSSLLKQRNSIPKDLPVSEIIDEIRASVAVNDVTTVISPTGSGKSVEIPLGLAEDYFVMTSLPTITAVLGLHGFIKKNIKNSRDVGYACGGAVNYRIESSRVAYVTAKHAFNYLKRVMKGSRKLPENFLLMLDEAHHPCIENASLRHLCLHMIRKGYKMKMIIASATLGEISIRGLTHKTIESKGRLFQITTTWNHDTIDPSDSSRAINDTVVKVTSIIRSRPNGGILVFCPGEQEVETVVTELEKLRLTDSIIYRLYSSLTEEEICEVLAPETSGKRKIVISTNVAESSVTIPGVRIVVDMGFQKTPYETTTSISLITEHCPRDKLTQRMGRAGREAPGEYFPMFTEMAWKSFDVADKSELERTMPYMIVLELLEAELDAKEILEIEDTKWEGIVKMLKQLELIDQTGKVTEMGKEISNYPFSLRSSVVVYKACNKINRKESEIPSILTFIVVAMIEASGNGSFFWIPKDQRSGGAKTFFIEETFGHLKGSNDLLTYLNIFMAMMTESSGYSEREYSVWAKNSSMNNKVLSEARQMFRRLIKMAYSRDEIGRSVDSFVFDKILPHYNISSVADIDDKDMEWVYSVLGNVYADCVYKNPKTVGKMAVKLVYHNSSYCEHVLDSFRSFTKITPHGRIPDQLVALNTITIKGGKGGKPTNYISCVFPYTGFTYVYV